MREQIHAKLADLYLRGKDPKLAAEQLEAIVQASPTNPQAYYFLGGIAYDQKKYAKAAENFSKTVLLSPDFEQAYYDLAAAQLASSQAPAAIATLEKARGQFAQNFTLELLLGMAYSRQKDFTNALQHFTVAEVVAKASDPKRLNSGFYLQLAAVYEGKGDYAEAERYSKQALEIEPDSAEVLNFLGYLWADRGVNLEQAREMIEKALKAEPKNAAFLDSLAWVMFKQKEPQPALEYMLKAIELNGEPDATLYDHLGDIYQALGQTELAREAWRKSVAIEPKDAVNKKLEGAQ
jgi:tetratricopeptide (TPR) repeat protein